jgi:peptidoglycan/xylan/chitin deacetylase (PgdA/CDA1 family)
MMRWFVPVAGLLALPALAEPGRFVSVAWHDVVDKPADRADDAVTTDSLVQFFDWIKAEGWTPVSAAQLLAANEGGPPLPEKAILLSFDDGYLSFYERVYPLLLAYRYPALLALVGQWMDTPPEGQVDYGGRPISRSRFVTWDQVRRMTASGLVEVGSHSFDMHRTVLINPQGSSAPAARSWAYDPVTGRRETDREHRARVRADLARARDRIAAETGAPPIALVWPFGRHSGPALEEARALGFRLAFNLEPEVADLGQPMELARYYPTRDPSLGEIVDNLRFLPPRAPTVRVACLDLAPLAAAPDEAARDALLGRMVEEVRALAPTSVVLDIGPRPAAGEALKALWLPSVGIPMASDIFGRAARQLNTRAGVQVFARIPLDAAAAAIGEEGLAGLAADVARVAMIDGLALDGEGVAAPDPLFATGRADVRAARARASDRASRVMAGATAIDSRLRLMLVAPTADPAGPPPHADALLLPPGADVTALAAAGWFRAGHSGRAVITLAPGPAPGQRAAIHHAQQAGATGVALCPAGPADVALSPAFSAASFPVRP